MVWFTPYAVWRDPLGYHESHHPLPSAPPHSAHSALTLAPPPSTTLPADAPVAAADAVAAVVELRHMKLAMRLV